MNRRGFLGTLAAGFAAMVAHPLIAKPAAVISKPFRSVVLKFKTWRCVKGTAAEAIPAGSLVCLDADGRYRRAGIGDQPAGILLSGRKAGERVTVAAAGEIRFER